MKKSILIIAVVFAVFTSCKKEKVETETPVVAETVLDYFPLVEGNYWVYEQSRADSNGTEIPSTWLPDSQVVKNDTVINGKTYHIIHEYNRYGSSYVYTKYYRDSADCIVSETGKIVFSIKPGFLYSEALLPDSAVYINYSIVTQTTDITVPLGTFDCIDMKGEFFREIDNFSIAHLTHKYHHKGTGPVKIVTRYVTGLGYIYQDLVRCHVQ